MKLQAIPATKTKPQTILLLTENNNKFASITKWGSLTIFGEDMILDLTELRQAHVIADNFDLFYQTLSEKDQEIERLKLTNIPTL